MQFFSKPAVILGSYVGLYAIKAIFSLYYGLENTEVRLLAVLFYTVVSYLAFLKKKFALWFMGIMLVLHIISVFIGLFVIPMEHYIFKIYFVVPGVYFTYGGIVLIRLARRLNAASCAVTSAVECHNEKEESAHY